MNELKEMRNCDSVKRSIHSFISDKVAITSKVHFPESNRSQTVLDSSVFLTQCALNQWDVWDVFRKNIPSGEEIKRNWPCPLQRFKEGTPSTALLKKNEASKKGIIPEEEGNTGALKKTTQRYEVAGQSQRCINIFKTAKSERKQLLSGKKRCQFMFCTKCGRMCFRASSPPHPPF